MIIVDCFMFASYDTDAVRLRLDALRDVVDIFVGVEGDLTHRGNPRDSTAHLLPVVPNLYTALVPLDPNASNWGREGALRDWGLNWARGLALGEEDRDVRFLVSDGDEIPHPDAIRASTASLERLLTNYREWYLDWQAPPEGQLVHQPVIGSWEAFQAAGGATAARWAQAPISPGRVGWHLNNLASPEQIAYKVSNCAHEEHDDDWTRDVKRLTQARANRMDGIERFPLRATRDIPDLSREAYTWATNKDLFSPDWTP